jgi:hypothetical protein
VPGGSPVTFPTVLLKINGLWLAVRVIASAFRDEGDTHFTTTNDCSGTPFFKILDFPEVRSCPSCQRPTRSATHASSMWSRTASRCRLSIYFISLRH